MGRARLLTALLAALLALAATAPAPAWDEIAWPLPRDAWPAGRAFRCRTCQIEVTIRPKLGFCNCTTGVTTDAEVDAVSDMDAVGSDFTADADGAPLLAAGLRGRVRSYTIQRTGAESAPASGIALSSHCDLLVAAAIGPNARDWRLIASLLDTPPVAAWIAQSLGLAP